MRKMDDFFAENSRNGCADISTFRNYFRLKLVFIVILWDGLFNEFCTQKIESAPTQLVSQRRPKLLHE